MVFVPTSKGTEADQEVVPPAVPEPPVDVAHPTDTTPTLSPAVPLIEIVAALVETIEEPGEIMLTVGGTVSVALPAPEGDPPVPPVGCPELPALPVPVPEPAVLPGLPPAGALLAGAPYKA